MKETELRHGYLTEPGFNDFCYEYEHCEDCPKWNECSMNSYGDEEDDNE